MLDILCLKFLWCSGIECSNSKVQGIHICKWILFWWQKVNMVNIIVIQCNANTNTTSTTTTTTHVQLQLLVTTLYNYYYYYNYWQYNAMQCNPIPSHPSENITKILVLELRRDVCRACPWKTPFSYLERFRTYGPSCWNLNQFHSIEQLGVFLPLPG